MSDHQEIKLRPLEKDDLKFVHKLDNNATIMRYWFEEPFEAYDELATLYEEHLHDHRERRFIIELNHVSVGIVELVEINHIHRNTEFQIIIEPSFQGRGLAKKATQLALEYGFGVLNLNKIYLLVDKDNAKAIHIYESCGFRFEALLLKEFFVHGEYKDVIRMIIFQDDYFRSVSN